MEYAAIILKLIEVAADMVERGKQTGELTDQQAAQLLTKAAAIFSKFDKPAPPPEGA